jgi:Asp-tRNA(Asn)/Glu-tRNA(Gln) amidotransferase A subunit family amidase
LKNFITARRDFLLGALLGVPAVSLTGRIKRESSTQSRNGNLVDLTATDAVEFLRSGDLSAEKYATALLEQCRKHRDLNAFIWQNEEQVLEAARSADKRRASGKLGRLHGLPILLKDNIDTAHAPTTAGTPALRNHRPRADAQVAASLFSAGAILLGKTNMHELAWSITSNNAAFGAVHNPYDPSMIPGGSSGGNGAAIAARMCTAGLGTDTGGSIRIPSALCGIAGFRPTLGRYSSKGVVPYSHTRDTVGPMARTVKDLVLLDSIVTGEHLPVAAAVLKGLRIGVPRGYFFENLDSSIAPVVETALAKLREMGSVLVEADIPRVQELSVSAATPISYYEVRRDLARYLRDSGTNLTIQELAAQIASPDVKGFYDTFVVGPQAPTQQAYNTAMKQTRPALQAAYRDYFRENSVAAIAFPTTVLPARPIGEDTEVELNGKKVSTFLIYLHNTRTMTLTGIPGLSLPIGRTVAGLPVGLELDCLWGQDRDLLGLGLALEALFGTLPYPVS